MTPDLGSSTDAFWEALDDGRFLIGRCGECGEAFFPPGPACPHCAGEPGTEESSGRGSLYSFTRLHRTAPGFDQPIVMGIVELDEGPRLLARIAADYEDLELGRAVRIEPCEYDGGLDRGRLADRPFFEAVPRDST